MVVEYGSGVTDSAGIIMYNNLTQNDVGGKKLPVSILWQGCSMEGSERGQRSNPSKLAWSSGYSGHRLTQTGETKI